MNSVLETGATGQNILHCDFYLISWQYLKVWWPLESAIDIISLPQTAFSAVTKQEAPRNVEQGIKQDRFTARRIHKCSDDHIIFVCNSLDLTGTFWILRTKKCTSCRRHSSTFPSPGTHSRSRASSSCLLWPCFQQILFNASHCLFAKGQQTAILWSLMVYKLLSPSSAISWLDWRFPICTLLLLILAPLSALYMVLLYSFSL